VGYNVSLGVAMHRLFESEIDSNSTSQIKVDNKESNSECPHYFGYLSEHKSDGSYPEKCLVCSRVVDCVLLPLASLNAFYLVEIQEKKESKRKACDNVMIQ
jgi:hypothetical protein